MGASLRDQWYESRHECIGQVSDFKREGARRRIAKSQATHVADANGLRVSSEPLPRRSFDNHVPYPLVTMWYAMTIGACLQISEKPLWFACDFAILSAARSNFNSNA